LDSDPILKCGGKKVPVIICFDDLKRIHKSGHYAALSILQKKN
jgi:hypothetical protein